MFIIAHGAGITQIVQRLSYGLDEQESWLDTLKGSWLKLDVVYQQFIDKHCKQLLIICSPGVRSVRELNEVPSKSYSSMQSFMHFIVHHEQQGR